MKKVNFSTTVKLLNLIKYILIFLTFYIFAFAGINEKVYCFGFGLLFALVWCNQNILICSPLFLVANLLHNFSFETAIFAGSTVIILLIFYGIHLKLKKPMKPLLVGLYALVSQIPTLFYKIYFGGNIILSGISLFLGMLFMFACLRFFTALFVRGFRYKMSWSEMLCGAVIVIALAIGLSSITIYGVEIIKLVSVFLILFCTFAFSKSIGYVVSGLLGVGTILFANNPVFVAPFLVWSLCGGLFKTRNRWLSVLSILAVELCMGFGLELYYNYDLFSFLPVLLGSLIFLFVPDKFLNEISNIFETTKEKVAVRNIVNRSRETISRKLSDLADVFSDMDRVFRSMIKDGGLNEEETRIILIEEIKEKVCKDCPEKNRCHRTFAEETTEVLNDLTKRTFQKGKSTLLDIPSFLTARCSRLNLLVSTLNNLTNQYKKYNGMINSVDTSKILVADQLCGVSKIMKNLSGEVNRNISFDIAREEKIMDELSFNDIICTDVAIYEENIEVVCVTLLIKQEDIQKEKIEKIVSKICCHPLQIVQDFPSSISGMQVITLKTMCKYNIIFGTASEKKNNSSANGDSFSVVRIESDKMLLALCDGMGSGEKAQEISHLAIGLVENFYKAGFDNDIILSTVNRLLSFGKEETYSALDICVVDVRKCTADFVKLGSPCGFVKQLETTSIVQGGALPFGILGEVKPVIKKLVLAGGDYIILCTDGIVDSFFDEEEMCTFINNLETKNPQIMAEQILDKAKKLSQQKNLVDDMTVLVCKIY